MKRCYLVRHAETLWNREDRLQGHSDLPLSPLGRRQAKHLGRYFASHHLDRVFASTLLRSQETAQAILAENGHGVIPVADPDLSELHLGTWEGLTPAEIDARFHGAYRQWSIRPSTVTIPDAEPLDRFRQRVRRVMRTVLGSFEAGECVVVSHGGVIAAWLAEVLGADYDIVLRRVRCDNGSITALDCAADVPQLLWINSTAHLGESCFPH